MLFTYIPIRFAIVRITTTKCS